MKDPVIDRNKRQVYVPECNYIDLYSSVEISFRVSPGIFQFTDQLPSRYRVEGQLKWKLLLDGVIKQSDSIIAIKISPKDSTRPFLAFVFPYTHYFVGKLINIVVFPPQMLEYELEVIDLDRKNRQSRIYKKNNIVINQINRIGNYRIRLRYLEDNSFYWSQWSIGFPIFIHAQDEEILDQQIFDHILHVICDTDINGVITLVRPDILPPRCPNKDRKWFPIPSFIGTTILLNEEKNYYIDPLQYYLGSIDFLIEKGFKFITWHDVLDQSVSFEKAIILQFDIDAGINSMEVILRELLKRNIVGTIMTHLKSKGWYNYNMFDRDLDVYYEAEKRGWAIGYHNNSIDNVFEATEEINYSQETLKKSKELFRHDVMKLRTRFNIRTFTHHGGNTLNSNTPIPEDLNIVGVDKPLNPEIWKGIDASFSDGGFISRPNSFYKYIESLNEGCYFIRNHPLKYANFDGSYDVLPLYTSDCRNITINEESLSLMNKNQAKQTLWLKQRLIKRIDKRFSYASVECPISKQLPPIETLISEIKYLRGKRNESFLEQYPWVGGDTRVFWWRLMSYFSPKKGKILNVGALPADGKEELGLFLNKDVDLVEMDVDKNRNPQLLMDITVVPDDYNEQFDCVLMYGLLPYVHSPSKALEAAFRVTKAGGKILLGFTSDIHPYRGGVWQPVKRPIHEDSLEPLLDLSLKGKLWSFSDKSIHELFSKYSKSNEVIIEYYAYYWYVIINKN